MTRAVFDRSMEQWYPAEEELSEENTCPICSQYKDAEKEFCKHCTGDMESQLKDFIQEESLWFTTKDGLVRDLVQIALDNIWSDY